MGLMLKVALAGSSAAATLWDESMWGNLPGATEAPAPFLVAGARNLFQGTTSSFDRDRLTLHVPPGESLTGLYLRDTNATSNGLIVDLYEGTDVSGPPLATFLLDELDVDTNLVTSLLDGLSDVTLDVQGILTVPASYVLEFQSTRYALGTEWDAGGDAPETEPGYDVGSLHSVRNQLLSWDIGYGDEHDWFRFGVPSDSSGAGVFLRDYFQEGTSEVGIGLFDETGAPFGTTALDAPSGANLLDEGLGLPSLSSDEAYQIRTTYGATEHSEQVTLEIRSDLGVAWDEAIGGDIDSARGAGVPPLDCAAPRCFVLGSLDWPDGADSADQFDVIVSQGQRLSLVLDRLIYTNLEGRWQLTVWNTAYPTAVIDKWLEPIPTGDLASPVALDGPALYRISLSQVSSSPSPIEYDLRLEFAEVLFTDGFESGDLSGWTG